jgi:hypothetical protein
MARGWESKNIESQQEEAARQRKRPKALTADEQARLVKRRGLELARARAEADMAHAVAPAHRAMLEQALADLDAQLRELKDTLG